MIDTNITFTPDQAKAKTEILTWLEDNKADNFYTLDGPAGSGKTWLVNHILKETDIKSVAITAPTHAAKRKISESTGKTATTLQKALGLRPNVTFESFDINKPVFDPLGEDEIGQYKLFVIDESSMINADAFDLIISKANMYNTKVLFMGDDYQLPPIGELKSKVFTHVDAISKLTTEVRQGSNNPNSELLALIREDIEYNAKLFEPVYLDYFNQSRKWNTAAKHNDAIYRINSLGLDFKFNAIDYLHKKGTTLVNDKGFEVLNAQQVTTRVSELFTDTEYEYNDRFVKFLSYTNRNVEEWSKFIRTKMFPSTHTNRIVLGEFLLGYSTIADTEDIMLENSREYFVTNFKPYINTHKIKGLNVELKDLDGNNHRLFIVDRESYEDFAGKANTYLNKAYANRTKRNWENFFNFKNSHILLEDVYYAGKKAYGKDIYYGYGSTVHKSQGSTYKHTVVNVKNILTNRNVYETLKLLYVAFSRSTDTNIILLK